MRVATSSVAVRMTAAPDAVEIPVALSMVVDVIPIPSNYGRITFDGSVITVS